MPECATYSAGFAFPDVKAFFSLEIMRVSFCDSGGCCFTVESTGRDVFFIVLFFFDLPEF